MPARGRGRRAVAPLAEAVDGLLAAASPPERRAIGTFLEGAHRAVASETARLRVESRGGFWKNRYTAPLGTVTRGRLVFVTGAPRMSLNFSPLPRANARVIMETSASRLEFTGAADASDLLQASFDGPQPDVRVAGGVVTVRYRRQRVAAFSTRLAKVALSGTIPWTVEIDGGITDLTGTLEAVGLERLDVEGGANHVRLDLPRPTGTAAVHIGGVVSSARLQRPAGVPVAVRLAGGVVHAARRRRAPQARLGQAALRRSRVQRQPRPVRAGGAGRRGRGDRQLGPAPEASGPADPSRDAGPCRCRARRAPGRYQASSFALAAANSSSERTPAACRLASC